MILGTVPPGGRVIDRILKVAKPAELPEQDLTK